MLGQMRDVRRHMSSVVGARLYEDWGLPQPILLSTPPPSRGETYTMSRKVQYGHACEKGGGLGCVNYI
jgi:hypothetical protein